MIFFSTIAASAASADPVFTFSQDGYDFRFEKGTGYQAFAGEGEGVQGLPSGFGAGPYLLSFTETPRS